MDSSQLLDQALKLVVLGLIAALARKFSPQVLSFLWRVALRLPLPIKSRMLKAADSSFPPGGQSLG